MRTHGESLRNITRLNTQLIYRSNGGDNCNMKKVREIHENKFGKKRWSPLLFVFNKKGDSNLIGFRNLFYAWDYGIVPGYAGT